MALITTYTSIYRPIRNLGPNREPTGETWQCMAIGVPIDIQPAKGNREMAPMGYASIPAVDCYGNSTLADLLIVGSMIRDTAGNCWRITSPPQVWKNGNQADYIHCRAEWMPTPAAL